MTTEDQQDSPAVEAHRSSDTSPLVIGVGASAASIESIEQFLAKLTIDPDQAIVLVVQHREAFDEERLRALLRSRNGYKVVDVVDGMAIEGETIFLCVTDKITTIQDGVFAVRPAEQSPGERATIDSFLVSLAEERAEQAIGVVLAGTGGDGTLGAATLKDRGGLIIAERTAEPDQQHLAESQSAAAIADFILTATEIPEHIHVYARHLRRLREKKGVRRGPGGRCRLADTDCRYSEKQDRQ